MDDIVKTNLWLRSADRVKIMIGEFNAKTFDDLFDQTYNLPWDRYLPMNAKFPVEGVSVKSQLHSTPDVQAVVKKAIAKKIGHVYFRKGRLPETGPVYPLEVSVRKNRVRLTLDTTGESLFKRGYKFLKGIAPLKENMAAALIELTDWHPDQMPLVDPMCGSGTIPIEAALMGKNIAPGLNRHFTFEKWEWVNTGRVKQLRQEAKAQAKPHQAIQIFASDIDPKMVNAVKINSAEAGLLDDFHIQQLDVKDFKTSLTDGVVVSNPPYGQRMESPAEVHKLYRTLGHVFKPMTSWSKYFLSSDLNFEHYYGQKATKRRKLYNGSLRTDYFQFWSTKNYHGNK
ncbi:MAG: class I SAM-dependent RNA methyltransferase [Acetilactobacillus jinshanensis]